MRCSAAGKPTWCYWYDTCGIQLNLVISSSSSYSCTSPPESVFRVLFRCQTKSNDRRPSVRDRFASPGRRQSDVLSSVRQVVERRTARDRQVERVAVSQCACCVVSCRSSKYRARTNRFRTAGGTEGTPDAGHSMHETLEEAVPPPVRPDRAAFDHSCVACGAPIGPVGLCCAVRIFFFVCHR